METEQTLEEVERDIILRSMQCLHHLKYIGDIALALKKNEDLLRELLEEVIKVREMMEEQ